MDGQEIAELCSDVTVLAPVLETFRPPNSTEPRVFVTIGDQVYNLLIDTRVSKSVFQNFPENCRAVGTMDIVGAIGITQKVARLQPKIIAIGLFSVEHAFLCMPDCPMNLLGRDLLCKL